MSKIIAIVNDRHNKQHLYNKYNIVDSLAAFLQPKWWSTTFLY